MGCCALRSGAVREGTPFRNLDDATCGAQESYREDLLQRVEDAARHFVYLHRTGV